MTMLFLAIAFQASSIDDAVRRAAGQEVCASRATGEATGAGASPAIGDSAGDAIVVCGRRDRGQRYRLPDRRPSFDWHGDAKSVMRERMSWGDAGGSGPQSCGPVGPGGWTGCLIRQWKKNDEQNPRRR